MNNSKPQLIPAYKDRQAFRSREQLAEKRWNSPIAACTRIAMDSASRVLASRDSFPWQFFRGNCHSHTQHSDGMGTVAETAEMVKSAGLDFEFVTDHWGVTQAPECREHGLWVGQEPVTQLHRIGMLGLDHAFEPQHDLLADYAAGVEKGATVFIPSSPGWCRSTVYKDEQKADSISAGN